LSPSTASKCVKQNINLSELPAVSIERMADAGAACTGCAALSSGHRGVQRICCFLTIRLRITWSTADSASELEMTSPAR